MGIEKYESEALNKLLEAFYAIVVRKKDGEDNERDIFRVLIVAVDRYLINKEYKNPIVRDGEFKSSNQIHGEKRDYFSTKERQAAELVSHDTKKKQSHISASILLTSNRMISPRAIRYKSAFVNFPKTTNCTRPTGSRNLFAFQIFTRAVLS